MDESFVYDSVPYPYYTFPQTNPSRLAVMAAHCGMTPAPPDKCRVLELGCANGTNILSFAYIFPHSKFVGVDLSSEQIERAKKTADELGITNTTLIKQDLLNFDTSAAGKFDYIIAHGLYSWVPEAVRLRTLEIYRDCLAPQGVGLISYNAYPGSYFRDIARFAMKFHTEQIPEPSGKVREGVRFLGFLKEAAKPLGPYGQILEQEYSRMVDREGENIFHDEFSDTNQPFYFYEFVKSIENYSLQYISECNAGHRVNILPPESENFFPQLTESVLREEQYRDFILGRRFRSSLVCGKDIQLDRYGCDVVRTSRMTTSLRSVSETPDLTDGVAEQFTAEGKPEVEIGHALTKAAVLYLSEAGMSSVGFDELILQAKAMLKIAPTDPIDESVDRTSELLMQLYKAEAVMLDRFEVNAVFEARERPVASRFARWQISRGIKRITTLAGMNTVIDEDLIKLVMLLLDGSRDRAMLMEGILERVTVPDDKRAAFENDLPKTLESILDHLAKCGLLEG